jgi:ribosomal protein S18 acetylase RimI-like enzyme
LVSIRLLTEKDATLFQALRLRGLQEAPDAFAVTADEFAQDSLTETAERLRPLGEPPERFVLGAFDEESILIGVVGFVREGLSKMRHKGIIWGMYVVPEGRKRGVGKLLLQELLKRSATIVGLEQVHLSVVTTNTAARQLYAMSGFQVYGIEPHAMKSGERYLDEELMLFTFIRNRQSQDV